MNIINYGKTWRFSPLWLEMPKTVEQLADIIKNAQKVRVMGARHSWSKGIITEDTLISLDKINRLLEVDQAQKQIRVQAGIRLKDLVARLEKHGLALSNLGSIDSQSLAGAICTGTHGTGINFQCLASQVEAFRMLDAHGNTHTFNKNDADFYAILVGMGCFGIIYEMILNVVESFQLHAITTTAPFDEVIENLEDYVTTYDHFKFWWLVPNEKLVLFKYNRTQEPPNENNAKRWFKDELLSVALYRSLVAIGKLKRNALIPMFNRFLTKEGGRDYERINKSHIGFLTPVPPVHRETEWSFDYANAQALLRSYKNLLLKSEHSYNFVQEVRFTKSDDFWLSPSYKRDAIWLSMYNIDPQHYDKQLAHFIAFARANGGRPHWGKEAAFDTEYLRRQYEKFDEFTTLVKQYDPNGKFENKWTARIFGKF